MEEIPGGERIPFTNMAVAVLAILCIGLMLYAGIWVR